MMLSILTKGNEDRHQVDVFNRLWMLEMLPCGGTLEDHRIGEKILNDICTLITYEKGMQSLRNLRIR